MAKISELDPAEAAQRLYDAYMAAHERYTTDPDGTEGIHPSKDYARWKAVGATDENTGLGPKELERTDHGADGDDEPDNYNPTGRDDPPGFAGKPADPKRAQDSAAAVMAEDDRIRLSGSADVEGQLWAARARRSHPARIRAMDNAIPALRRLR